MNKPIDQKRNGILDILKIICTLCIILHHYQQITGAHWEHFNFWYDKHFYFGYLVELFFLISGIVISKEEKNIREGKPLIVFFGKKYFRFFPCIALSAVCYEILIVIFQASTGYSFSDNHINWGGTLFTVLCIQSWFFPDLGINNPIWYISVLLLCYLIMFLLIRISEKHKTWKLNYLYFLMVLLGCATVTNDYNGIILNTYTGRGLYAFFFGLLFVQLANNWKAPLRYISSGIIFVFVTIALILYPDFTLAGEATGYGANLALLYLYYPAVILFLDNPLCISIFSRPWITLLAKISLGAFIWHHVIHTAFVMAMIISNQYYDVSAPVIVGLVIFFDYLLGILSYFCIEKPFIKFVSKQYASHISTYQ